MATNMLPHNLTESVNASLALLENPNIEFDELIKIIPGPDFPTGGIINGSSGLIEAAKTGKGRIVLRAKAQLSGESMQPNVWLKLWIIKYNFNLKGCLNRLRSNPKNLSGNSGRDNNE